MNNKIAVIAILAVLVSSPSEAKNKSKEKHLVEKRGSTNSCVNVLDQTEDFNNTAWSKSSTIIQYNQDIQGPLPGTWAQKWVASSSSGYHVIFTSVPYVYEESALFSIYAKLASPNVKFGITLVGIEVDRTATWSWNGTAWTELDGDATITSGVESAGNGWYRFFIYNDAVANAEESAEFQPSIVVTGGTGTINTGSYIWGANLVHNQSILCGVMRKGNSGFQPLVTKRGYPNDFWYNKDFKQNLVTSSDGTEFETDIADTMKSGPAMWFASDQYMDLSRAWGITTSSDAGVMLIDLEVSSLHYDLNDNIYHNDIEILGESGVDDDGNGLIDDIMGWDWMSYDNKPYMNSAEEDIHRFLGIEGGNNQHGTQMASFIGAVGNNESWTGANPPNRSNNLQGTVGILWDVPILPIRGLASGSRFGVINDIPETMELFCANYADWLNMNNGENFKVASMSYLGTVSNFNMRRFADYGIIPVKGYGNYGVFTTPVTTRIDTLVYVGAIRRTKTTGNTIDTNGNGSMSFGIDVDVCGYSSAAVTNYWNGTSWTNLSALDPASMIFATGMFAEGHIADQIMWTGNYDSNEHNDVVDYGMIPTPGLTSAATAEVAGLCSMIYGVYPQLSILQVKRMMERGAVPDVYKYSTTSCANGDCSGGWTMWKTGTVYALGDIVQGTVTNSYTGNGIYYTCIAAGTSAGTGYNLTGGSDTGAPDWYTTAWVSSANDWVTATSYSLGNIVRSAVDGKYYVCRTSGNSGGNANDLDGGSDTGCNWYLTRLKGDWKTEGFLGAGRVNAYRAITLWGTVTDTTLSGTVYVSGDVHFKPTTAITIADNTVFKIAPTDIYETEIYPMTLYGCNPKYRISGLTVVNASPPNPKLVEIYFGGASINIGSNVVFESNAENKGKCDWGGIWVQTGTTVVGGTNIVPRNTTLGAYK